MDSFSDPFGFTKQTASLLRGLGASELITECKKRNISTDVLHELSVEELVMLGTDLQKAQELQSTLNIKKRRSGILITNVKDRNQHFLEIIKHGEQHFSLIQALVAYCRLRLLKERNNTFIDADKGLSASKVLPIAIKATLKEIDETRENLSELEELLLRSTVKPKRNHIRRVCIFVSGLGLVTLVLFKICITRLF